MLAKLVTIVAPVYLCAGIGYGWVKSGRRYDSELVTDLVTTIGAPCLVFTALVKMEVAAAALLEMALATAVATTGFTIAGFLVLRVVKLPATTYLAPLVFGNTGNMGLPICLFAFGPPGLALGASFFATAILIYFTVGQWFWTGRVSFSQLLKSPLAWAPALAAAVIALDINLPAWFLSTTELLGDFTIPLMALTLGVSLAELRIHQVGRSLWLAVVRLVCAFGVGLLVVELLGLEGTVRAVFLIDCAMPAAVINFLLARRYDRHPADVAGLVVATTLVSFVTVPLVLAWVIR